uniref:Myosin VIIA and Rab interacting protein n=1 Tax=Anas platyrhynchos platyrhynchos TaxID=8840 RepID=U3HYI6_ANAPP
MGRKLDLSGLTDEEAEHVLQVVQRDFSLRKKEEERLSEMKQKLDEEGNKCNILSKQQKFNEHCCIRCCSPFTFLINSKRQCQDCKYNICKSCSSYQKKEKAWICSVCQQTRLQGPGRPSFPERFPLRRESHRSVLLLILAK